MSELFPKGQERRKIVEQTAEEAARFKAVEAIEVDLGHYTWTYSPLEGPVKSEEVVPYADSFKDLLPTEETSLRNYIETLLQERKGNAIGVEFGGVGSRLFRGFTRGFFARSIAVNLSDYRGSRVKEADVKIRHEVLEGNIFDPKTYESLNQLLGGEKIDLMIERMGKGMEFVPVEPYAVSNALQAWYNSLREGGIMFVQTPVVFNNLLEVWVAKIQREFPGAIEISFQIGDEDREARCSAFRLRKLPGAPEELPLLDPRAVGKIPKVDFRKP